MPVRIEILRKERIKLATDEVIDLLRKKFELSPLECAYALENLLESLQETLGATFKVE